MKNWKIIGICLCISTISFGQSVNYKILKDQPEDVANYWVNFELMQLELAYKNMSGASLGFGLNSVVNFKNKLGAEFTFRRSYFTLLDNTPRTQFELGAYYHLISRTRSRNQKVVLSSKTVRSGGKEFTETKFIKVPSTILKSLGVRAGFAYNSIPFEAEVEDHGFEGKYKIRTGGIYAGILNTKQMNLMIDTDNFGKCGHGFVRRYYLDVLFNPIRSLTDIQTDVKDEVNKIGMLGFRGGVEFLLPEPRKVHGNALYTKVELGMRPQEGFYMMCSFGLSYKRKVKSLGQFQPVREKE